VSDLDSLRVDRTAFRMDSFRDESDAKAYWKSRMPAERLEHLEILQQIHYGYDPATDRLQRVFEVAKLERR
jgi:hypothetical protein